MSFEEKSKTMLLADEGCVLRPYRDGKGFWTIGVGHLIGERLENFSISKETAMQILREDIQTHLKEAQSVFGSQWNEFTEHQRLGILNMVFNLGVNKFLKFQPTIALMKAGRWKEAGDRIQKTPYGLMVGKRDERVAKLFLDEWPYG